MKIDVTEDGGLVLGEVFNGIGLDTGSGDGSDLGVLGLAQRDGGLEVMVGGELLVGIYPGDSRGPRVDLFRGAGSVRVQREQRGDAVLPEVKLGRIRGERPDTQPGAALALADERCPP